MSKQKKSSVSIFGVLGSLIIAIIVFFILIQVESSMVGNVEVENIVVAKKNITKNTEISEANIKDYFEVKSVQKANVIEGTCKTVEEVLKLIKNGDKLYIEENITKNEQLQKKDIKLGLVQNLKIENAVEVGFKVASFDYGVGGIIREGDIVDVYSTKQTEEGLLEEILLKDAYVGKAFDAAGVLVKLSDTTTVAVAYNVIIENEKASDFVKKLEDGAIRIVKKNNIEY